MATTTSTFTLYKSLIYETVKNETHITAHSQRATDKSVSEVAYNEEAGDEAYHERKLERELYASLDKLKGDVNEFVDSISSSISGDVITITLVTNSRTKDSQLTPLANLMSKYVEDNMLFEWWSALNANTAKVYSEHLELDKQSIIKLFEKTAPTNTKDYSNITTTII